MKPFYFVLLLFSMVVSHTFCAEEYSRASQSEYREQQNTRARPKQQQTAHRETLEWEIRSHRVEPFLYSIGSTAISLILSGIVGSGMRDEITGKPLTQVGVILGCIIGYAISKLATSYRWNSFIRKHPIVEETITETMPDGTIITKKYQPPVKEIKEQEESWATAGRWLILAPAIIVVAASFSN